MVGDIDFINGTHCENGELCCSDSCCYLTPSELSSFCDTKCCSQIAMMEHVKDMSAHLHELGNELEKFSCVKLSDEGGNDILKEMELTLRHLGQNTRDIGKKVSNEKDYIHSEHFWNKTAGYLDDLSSSVYRINTDIKQD